MLRKDFAACAREHMVSVNFTCRDQKLAMNSCLRKNGTMAEQDRAREEWFATRLQKKKDAAEQEAERLRKVYAERKRIEEIEERQKQTETNKSSWWPFR
jgi:COX assembly protein 1